MTDRELMQMALDALEKLNKGSWILADFEDEVYASIEALRARLAQPEPDDGYCQACDGNHCTAKNGCIALDNPRAQPEPEPVAWRCNYCRDTGFGIWGDVCQRKENHTAPPQREWQGLTDEEIWNVFCDARLEPEQGWLWNGRAIEAKLKEKNA